MSLSSKPYLIISALTIVGKAFAKKLVTRGTECSLILIDQDEVGLQQLAKELRALNPNLAPDAIEYLSYQYSDSAQGSEIVDSLLKRYEVLPKVLYCASHHELPSIQDLEIKHLEQEVEDNHLAFITFTKAIIKQQIRLERKLGTSPRVSIVLSVENQQLIKHKLSNNMDFIFTPSVRALPSLIRATAMESKDNNIFLNLRSVILKNQGLEFPAITSTRGSQLPIEGYLPEIFFLLDNEEHMLNGHTIESSSNYARP